MARTPAGSVSGEERPIPPPTGLQSAPPPTRAADGNPLRVFRRALGGRPLVRGRSRKPPHPAPESALRGFRLQAGISAPRRSSPREPVAGGGLFSMGGARPPTVSKGRWVSPRRLRGRGDWKGPEVIGRATALGQGKPGRMTHPIGSTGTQLYSHMLDPLPASVWATVLLLRSP